MISVHEHLYVKKEKKEKKEEGKKKARRRGMWVKVTVLVASVFYVCMLLNNYCGHFFVLTSFRGLILKIYIQDRSNKL